MCNCGMSNAPAMDTFSSTGSTGGSSSAGSGMNLAGGNMMNWLLLLGVGAGGYIAGKKMKKGRRK